MIDNCKYQSCVKTLMSCICRKRSDSENVQKIVENLRENNQVLFQSTDPD